MILNQRRALEGNITCISMTDIFSSVEMSYNRPELSANATTFANSGIIGVYPNAMFIFSSLVRRSSSPSAVLTEPLKVCRFSFDHFATHSFRSSVWPFATLSFPLAFRLCTLQYSRVSSSPTSETILYQSAKSFPSKQRIEVLQSVV